MESGIGSQQIVQVGLVVHDIEKSRAAYARIFGVPEPPIIETDPFELAQTQFKDQPSCARAKLCFFSFGQVQIELIQPDRDPNSTWREHLDVKGEGVHHLAFDVPDMAKSLAHLDAQGAALIQKGEYTGGRYAYVASAPQLGVELELLEND